MAHREENFPAQVTTNAFADLDTPLDLRGCEAAVICLANAGANGATYQVLGSINGTDYAVITGIGGNIAAGAVAYATVHDPWPTLKVQIKDQVNGSHTTVRGDISALVEG